MNAMTKTALLTASILSMGALTACQSTTAPKEGSSAHMMGKHKSHHKMTPEQREQFKQMRKERKEFNQQAKSACNGKSVNQAVQIKVGEKTIDGTCNMVFKADRKAMKEMKHDFRGHHAMKRDHRGGPRMKDMTVEQRTQIKQEFEQKRAERKAQRDAIQKSCVGQRNGQAIQVKMGDKLIPGQCSVKFKPNQPLNDMRPAMPTKSVVQTL